MLILGYPRRLAVNQKEVKEVRTVAERLVTESGIPAEFPKETKRGVFLSLLLGVVSIIAALLVAGLVYLFIEIGGDLVGFVQVLGILAFGFSALLMIWSVLLIITAIFISPGSKTSAGRNYLPCWISSMKPSSCYVKKTAVI